MDPVRRSARSPKLPALRGLKQPLVTAKKTIARVVETHRLAEPTDQLRERHVCELEARTIAVRDALEQISAGSPSIKVKTGREITGCARRLAEAAEAATAASRQSTKRTPNERGSTGR